jgi:hypothetical protein
MILYLPYPPNIATADFFLLRIVMAELADLSLSQDSLKISLKGSFEPLQKDGPPQKVR